MLREGEIRERVILREGDAEGECKAVNSPRLPILLAKIQLTNETGLVVEVELTTTALPMQLTKTMLLITVPGESMIMAVSAP